MFRSFSNQIVPQCGERGIGVIGMKTLGGGMITGQAALLASVKDVAGDERYELYKTTQRMDGPYHVKQHGFQVA